MATGHLYTKFHANRSSVSRDMLAERQTHTDRQADRNILLPYQGGVTKSHKEQLKPYPLPFLSIMKSEGV